MVLSLLEYQLHLKLYHWQTRSAPRHVAAENLLGKLQQFTDDVVEFCQGRHGIRIQFDSPKSIMLYNMVEGGKDKSVATLHSLLEMLDELECDDEAIDNKRQEMLGEVQRTLYLFSLQ